MNTSEIQMDKESRIHEVKTCSENLVRGDVAIIGLSCIFPGAMNLDTYWQNIISKVDAIIDVPSERWDTETFYDPDLTIEDRLHCKRGGYLPGSLPFNPLDYGVMPIALEGAEPEQFLLLQLVYNALEDAGYPKGVTDSRSEDVYGKGINGERTEVIVGKGNYLSSGHANLIQRRIITEQTIRIISDLHPEYTTEEIDEIKEELLAGLRIFNSETAPSLIPNITTGRVTNRLDFMGSNYTVDGACASSLLAVDIGVRNLLTKKSDLVIAGGVHICNDLPFLILFEAIHAVSPTSQIRPFDKNADGTIPGEGIGVVILKRLEDAERDGNRIYAVIKGVGTSSDGRAMSVLAPRTEGEELSLRRAYQMAGIDPKTVELIEAHGTATPVGDASEIEALKRVFGSGNGQSPPHCALGTIKSMIGHTMPAAGMAALIKTALALHHKVLPATLHCNEPNPKFELEKTDFYINTETRPWVHGREDIPRRAGINAFGLGGVNAHVVLEEYQGTLQRSTELPDHQHYQWDTEVCILQADSRQSLIEQARQLQQYLAQASDIHLKDLAYTLNSEFRIPHKPASGVGELTPNPSQEGDCPNSEFRLAIVVSSVEDLKIRLDYAIGRLSDPDCKQIKDIKGTYFFEEPLGRHGKLAFLFPGEGAQYLNMLSDLCLHFPEVRACFDRTDQAFINQGRDYLPSQIVFPPPTFTKKEQDEAQERLWKMDGALETVLTANWALTTLLEQLEIRPDMVVGHSSGEFSALLAAGIAEADDNYFKNLGILNTYYERAAADGEIPEAVMIAAGIDSDKANAIINGIDGGIYVAMDNCPHQVVIVGEEKAAQNAIEQLRNNGIMYEKLPFNRGYHTPMFEEICQKLYGYFEHVPMTAPKVEIYSCTTMAPFANDPEDIRKLVVDHWMHPVEFRRTIEAMYDSGTRIFVEVGPRGNLTTFVDDILRGRPYLAMPSNVPRRSGISQLNHLLGILAAHGVSMNLNYLYARRSPKQLSLEIVEEEVDISRERPVTPTKEKKPPIAVDLRLDFPILHIPDERVNAAKQRLQENSKAEKGLTDSAKAEDVFSKASEKPKFSQQKPELDSAIIMAQPSPSSSFRLPTSDFQLPIAQVMQQYLQTMENFLEVQQEVMLSFITSSKPTSSNKTEYTAHQGQIVGEIPSVQKMPQMPQWKAEGGRRLKSPLPPLGKGEIEAEGMAAIIPPDVPSPAETQLIATSLKPSEVISEETSEIEPSATPIVKTTEISPESLRQTLLEIVSKKTGYPEEMLDLNLDMEADLGIDSIKRIEILGAFQEKYGLNVEPADTDEETAGMEQVAGLKTLQQVIDFLNTVVRKITAQGEPKTEDSSLRSEVEDQRRRQSGTERGEQITSKVESKSEAIIQQNGVIYESANVEQWVDTTPNNTSNSEIPPYCLLGTVISLTPKQELVVRRQIDWKNEDIFMEDHVFGPKISGCDDTLKGLPVIPLTVGMEIMAQGAAALLSERQLIGMKDIRTYQWIQVEQPVTLQITAKRISDDEAAVFVHEISKADDSEPILLLEGTMVFGDSFPESPLADSTFPLRGERIPKHTAESLYREHMMFHGPRFQNVVSMDRVGEDGFVGQLEVFPTNNLFKSNTDPLFVTDPFVMDAAGQLVGYWPFEYLETGFLIFPIRVREVLLYCPTPPVSTRVVCRVQIQQITPTQIRTDIEVIKPDGRLWMHIIGWEDWRFYFPPEMFDFWRFPNKGMISKPWDIPISLLPPEISASLECRRMDKTQELGPTIWETVWAYLVLNRQERRIFRDMMEKKQDKRRVEWMLGRTAAKDALRLWYKKRYNKELYPADIDISNDENGRPIPGGIGIIDIEDIPNLSLAHIDSIAVAVAGDGNQRLGIDVEEIRQRTQGFETLSFTKEEQTLLDSFEKSAKDEWITRFWCAKESVAKALGRGMIEGPQSVIVKQMDAQTGIVKAALNRKFSNQFPEFDTAQITAYTTREEDYIVAIAIC